MDGSVAVGECKYKNGGIMKCRSLILSALLYVSSGFCMDNQSDAVVAGDFVYVSAQLPIDPATGKIVQGDIGSLTNLVIDHIQHVLRVKGFQLKNVVKTEVYLDDIRNFTLMDQAYGVRFPSSFPPARDVIVSPQLLSNSPIQISCIAYRYRD
jgi:2-iminobutanoate/2-iminopropanoate deaminase